MIDQYYILYSSLLSNIKTENSLINFILSSLLMLLISEFIKNKNSYYEYIENIINKFLKKDNNYVEIIIESNENSYSDRNGGKHTKTIYSEYFQAISYYNKIIFFIILFNFKTALNSTYACNQKYCNQKINPKAHSR